MCISFVIFVGLVQIYLLKFFRKIFYKFVNIGSIRILVYIFIIIIYYSIGVFDRFELEYIVLVNKINVYFIGECFIVDQYQRYGFRVVDQIFFEEYQSLVSFVTYRWFLNVDFGKVFIFRYFKCQVFFFGLVCGYIFYCSFKDGIESLKKKNRLKIVNQKFLSKFIF